MAELVFVGHTSVDRVRNPNGERIQPGGAALYAAYGAKTLCRDVCLVTAVGSDYSFWDALSEFPAEFIVRRKGGSTRFDISYDADWNAHYHSSETGPASAITTRALMKAIRKDTGFVHVAPMNPPKVERMVSALRESGLDVRISVNSCINYMDSTTNRKAILRAASMSDIFILNERELHALTGKEVVSEAIKSISAKTLVLTLGEIGTMIRSEGTRDLIPALAAITKRAVDVTGAGDTWSGSFLAAFHKTGSWIKAVSFASFVSAVKCTGWNFEKVRALHFESVEEVYDIAIAMKEKGRQLRLTEALKDVK
ncbi:MAG: carbohydrate kinase family protein [Candidatus Verstraetearchaeota archaeon]|nr:carbohydrate kinase family protein [Candidatus Verstraetearchaeota archaeon]